MKRIKKGEEVIVKSGNDRKQQGKVLRILVKQNCAIVEGVRLQTKCVKANPQKEIVGGRIKVEGWIPLSKISLINPITKKADKIGIKKLESGQKVRYFKSNSELVDIIEKKAGK